MMGDPENNKDLLIDLEDSEVIKISEKSPTLNLDVSTPVTKEKGDEIDPQNPLDISKKNDDDFDESKEKLKQTNLELEEKLRLLQIKLDNNRNDLEREVQRRCEMEQRFTEDAKRSSDQIEELIAKSNQDDAKIMEFQKRIEYYTEETSSMIESFTSSREMVTSQLQHLRYENDFLLGKFLTKSRELQNEVINLPQTVEELQFYCLRITEKLILATLARERLEESVVQGSRS